MAAEEVINLKKCPRCDNPDLKGVSYKCYLCFTEYCVVCPGSKEGKVCPKCGQAGRIVIDSK